MAFGLRGMIGITVANALAERGIGVRAGCHCAHLLVKHMLRIPPFLEEFQGLLVRLLPKLVLPGVVRASIGIGNGAEDIDAFVRAVREVVATRGASNASLRRQMDDFVETAACRVYGEDHQAAGVSS